MNNLDAVSIDVKVAGKPCDIEQLELIQSMNHHHRFRIIVNYKLDDQSTWSVGPDVIFKQLGEKVSITFTHKESGETTHFFGLISDISTVGFDGNQGQVILEGGSPTLFLDRDPAMDCYVEQSLSAITDDIVSKSGIQIARNNSPKFTDSIPYVARYKETSYGFLSRLLYSYGEWFYYNGEKLIIGDPNLKEEKEIQYDVDMTFMSLKASVRNLNTSVYDYDPLKDERYYEQGGKATGSLSVKSAESCSKPLYPTETLLPALRAIHSGSDIQSYGNSQYNRNFSELSHIEGSSRNCGIKLGALISAKIPDTIPNVSVPDLGSYRIIHIKHTVGKDGRYLNEFKGIPGSISAIPWGDVTMPVAYPEMAVVTDNADPENQGRVKVRFKWQDNSNKESYWMRVQSPDAGNSDKVDKNRGFVFIPEKDDLVMVGFEQGNPDRPFIMGSLFYKKNSKGAESKNNVKTITTRSGVAITFDDSKADGSITISDPSGNTVVLGGDKTISISAPDKITLAAKEITISGEDKVNIESKEISGNASQKITLAGTQSVDISSDSKITQGAPNISIEGKVAVDIKGINVTVDGSAATTVKGTVALNLN